MATFRERNGKVQARVQRNDQYISKSFGSKRDAQLWARGVEREIDLGTYAPPASIQGTVGDLLRRYRAEVSPLHRGGAVEAIRLQAMERTTLAKVPLDKLTAKDIAGYRDARLVVVSSGTVARELQILSSLFNTARKEWALAVANPVMDVRKPSPGRGRDRTLEAEEEVQLMEALTKGGRDEQGQWVTGTRNPWIAPIVSLGLLTAMRRGELLALRWEHVDLKRGTANLLFCKNGEDRTIPLSPKAVAVLRSIPRALGGQVFPVSAMALRKAFERARALAGLQDVRFHDLRHTAISRMAQVIPNVIELAAISGHRDVKMLSRYYHVKPEALAAKLYSM